MPTFRYRAATLNGRVIEKTVIADSKASLKDQLEKKGDFVLNIKQAKKGTIFPIEFRKQKRFKEKDFFSFNQEFSVLIESGFSVVSALNAIIEKDVQSELNDILSEIREDISSGDSLSEAFGKYSHLFSNLYSASLKAGEKSGNIPSALLRYIEYMKKVAEIKKKVVSASVYPIILTAVSIFVLFFLVIYVVPAISGSFFESGTKLPWITNILVTASNAIRSNFGYFFAVIFFASVIFFYFSKKDYVKIKIDMLKLKTPFLGELYTQYMTSRLSRTMATLLNSGTSLPDSISISCDTVNNILIRQRLIEVKKMIEQGEGFAESLRLTKVFPRLAIKMISAGESGGALERVLNNIADFYDNNVEEKLTVLTSAIEPALMVIMGLLIGLIVLAMYLPIFQLAGTIG
ncbi:MAG: type II secretion system F family protein [Deltaproteobacteria bacterium]|nr:type II secretion system F family protein [Deltaproteobacteria bacterium]